MYKKNQCACFSLSSLRLLSKPQSLWRINKRRRCIPLKQRRRQPAPKEVLVYHLSGKSEVNMKGISFFSFFCNLRPIRYEHWPYAPGRSKDIERLGKAIIVDEASVDGEHTHQQNNVPSAEHHAKHLGTRSKKSMKCTCCSSCWDNVV